MKKLSYIFFLFTFTAAFSQQVSDYKYISIPAKFKDKKMNNFGLDRLLALELNKKKYLTLSEDRNGWPEEAKNNPCLVLVANLSDTSNLLKNKVEVNVLDCSGKLLLNSKGNTMIKEYAEGFADALKNSVANIPVSNPVNLPMQNTAESNTTPKINTDEKKWAKTEIQKAQPAKKTEAQNTTNAPQIYSNGTLNLQKIQIGNGQFILANPNSSVPYATFSPSSRADTFHVTLENGSMTLGYEENNSLIIEIPNTDGSFRKEIFVKK